MKQLEFSFMKLDRTFCSGAECPKEEPEIHNKIYHLLLPDAAIPLKKLEKNNDSRKALLEKIEGET
ncbi:MAG: hypothetical protein EBS53_09790 [Bacteroidetes bacterium]|nr:hypothetical protein [Bacteroidota bacterium]